MLEAVIPVGDIVVGSAGVIEFGHAVRERFEFLLDGAEIVKNRHALGENRAPGERKPVLRKVSGGNAFGDRERAVVQSVKPSKDFHQRCLTRPIAANQADVVVGRDQPVDIFVKQFVAEAFAGTGELNHPENIVSGVRGQNETRHGYNQDFREAHMTPFAGWENFYVIVGSSAGALIGLQFVVITLIADRAIGPGQQQAGAAFATPTIVHFSAVLLLSAGVNAPWRTLGSVAEFLGLVGILGLLYEIVVIWRMRTQPAYRPQFEDWMFHAVLPLAAYTELAGTPGAAREHTYGAMFGVAAAALVLLFVGIHNAWDAVTYHVFVGRANTK